MSNYLQAIAYIKKPENRLACLFLLSGISALIYQLVWQRILFAALGINIESVTVIVSVFMFGLGIGALIGGYIQKWFAQKAILIFILLELIIGLYGLISIPLLQYIGVEVKPTSLVSLCVYVYAILALPTLLMGMTLPVLTSHLNKVFYNIGKSLSTLYAYNTFGSAFAAWITVELLFPLLGLQKTIMFAVFCNFTVAVLAYLLCRKQTIFDVVPQIIPEIKATRNVNVHIAYPLVLLLSTAIGYIALSQEILWFRIVGFLTGNAPNAYGYLLAAYLVGVGISSLKVKQLCEDAKDPFVYLIRILLIAIFVYYISVPVISLLSMALGKLFGVIFVYLFAEAMAFLIGGIFPLLIYISLASYKNKDNIKVSQIYAANIIGCVLGPLVTGFVLLEYFTLEKNVIILTILSVVVTIVVVLISKCDSLYKRKALFVMAVMLLFGGVLHNSLYRNLIENLQFGPAKHNQQGLKIIENRSGIIVVEASKDGDIVYGNGIYDGRISIDPIKNSNLITRAYMVAGLHHNPTRVLEIGLSSGSWAKVLTSYTSIEELISVEINKGYIDLINQYPENASIFKDKRFSSIIDDGRRWLKANPDEKFDLIVMNTTFHWRSNSTNVLSKEFLELWKRHLNDSGVIYYNTTGSKDIPYTATQVFKHVTQYMNFVAASDAPFNVPHEVRRANLLKFIDDNDNPLFLNPDMPSKVLDDIVNYDLPKVTADELKEQGARMITDDNMITEFKFQ